MEKEPPFTPDASPRSGTGIAAVGVTATLVDREDLVTFALGFAFFLSFLSTDSKDCGF